MNGVLLVLWLRFIFLLLGHVLQFSFLELFFFLFDLLNTRTDCFLFLLLIEASKFFDEGWWQ
jgi:hypothetical protein